MRHRALCLVLLVSCWPLAAETISGTVFTEDGATPLPDADVVLTIYRSQRTGGRLVTRAEATLDARGRYTVEMQPGEISVLVAAPGYVPAESERFDLLEGGRLDAVDVTLTERAGRIVGRVVSEDGFPIPGAVIRVDVQPQTSQTVRPIVRRQAVGMVATDANGDFVADHTPAGPHFVTAFVEGHAPGAAQVDVVAGAEAQVEVVVQETLPGTGNIEGKIVDTETREAVAWANVSVRERGAEPVLAYRVDGMPWSVSTEADGTFFIHGVPPGVYDLVANYGRNQAWDGGYTLGEGAEVTVAEGKTVLALDVPATRCATAAVHVLQADGETPVSFGSVRIMWPLGEAGMIRSGLDTDFDGWVRLTSIEPGEREMSAAFDLPDAPFGEPVAVLLAPGQEATVELAVGEITGLRGVVVDADTEEPIPGASIMTNRTREPVVSGADGSFLLEPFGTEDRNLVVAAEGHVPYSLEWRDDNEAPTEPFRAAMFPGARLTGIARDAEGQPMANAVVCAHGVPGPEGAHSFKLGRALAKQYMTRADAEGRWALTGLPEATFLIIAHQGIAEGRRGRVDYAYEAEGASGSGSFSIPSDSVYVGYPHQAEGVEYQTWVFARSSEGEFLATAAAWVTVAGREPVEVDDLVLAVTELVTVSGIVVQEGTETPIAGATVAVEKVERPATTDAQGRFTIEDIPVGPWNVGAAAPSYGFAEQRPPAAGDMRLELPRCVPVGGTVTDTKGQPVPGALLRVEGLDIPSAIRGNKEAREAVMDGFLAQSDAQGRYRIAGVPLGPHLIVGFASEPGRSRLEMAGGRTDIRMMTEGVRTLANLSGRYWDGEVRQPVRIEAWSQMGAPTAAGCAWAIIEGDEPELSIDITLALPDADEG